MFNIFASSIQTAFATRSSNMKKSKEYGRQQQTARETDVLNNVAVHLLRGGR